MTWREEMDAGARQLNDSHWDAVFAFPEPHCSMRELPEPYPETVANLLGHLDWLRERVLAWGCWRALVTLQGDGAVEPRKREALHDLGLYNNARCDYVTSMGHAVLRRAEARKDTQT